MKEQIEENPFVNQEIAKQWATSVEIENGNWRDRVLYPTMQQWIETIGVKSPVVLDIGAGQGRGSTEIHGYGKYIGVEPSPFLVDRAKELYSAPDREFVIGNAYEVPVDDASADGVISVNVLFHLANIEKAIEEMARVLKTNGSFFLNTANNDSLEIWKKAYTDLIVDEKKMQGRLRVPGAELALNTLYFQPNQLVIDTLEKYGLHAEKISYSCEKEGRMLFITIEGRKV